MTVRNGVEVNRAFEHGAAHRAVLSRTGFPDDSILVITACRLSEEKGLDCGVEAFAKVQEERPNLKIRWVIAGAGPEEARIREQIFRLDLQDRICLWGFEASVSSILPAFRIFFLPSRREGLPLSLLEAMLAGCLPVVSDVDGIPEVLGGSGIGVMTAQDDVGGLAAGLIRMAELAEGGRSEMVAAAQSRVRDHFSQSKVLDELCEVIENA
ncbi:glycosyltransferase family 4 protein [Planctellipticum variicoloris]|nr:glycosyltransferase family 4 protein [Planctomycetaceae bacterium SH412]